MKKWHRLLTVIATILLSILFGCSAMMDACTPCEIEPEACEYSGQAPKKYLPFTSLLDSKRISAHVDYANQQNQTSYRRMAEDDDSTHGFLTGRATFHEQQAFEFQQSVFTPNGLIGLLLPTLFGGTLGALLIKRPGDTNGNEKPNNVSTSN